MGAIGNNIEVNGNKNNYDNLSCTNGVTIPIDEAEKNSLGSGQDVLELTYQHQSESLHSENYTNISKALILRYEYMNELMISINNNLFEYFSDDSRNIDDLKAYYKEVIESEGPERLQETYDVLLNKSVGNACGACLMEGREVAAKYNHVGDTDYVYYNADYYYALEEAKVVLKEVADELAESYNIDKVDPNGTESRRELTNGPNYNFNETWNKNSKNIVNRCTMIDTSYVPPKDFVFFFKQSRYNSTQKASMDYSEAQKGVLEVCYKGNIYSIDIMFNNSLVLGEIKLFYNASQMVSGDMKNILDEEYKKFLSNFNVYTRQYDFFYNKKQRN